MAGPAAKSRLLMPIAHVTMARMTSRAANFCFDAADPYAQMMWWSQVLGDYHLEENDPSRPGDEEAGLIGPNNTFLLFLKVPEEKTIKNRVHFCLRSTDLSRDEEVDRILGLGATMVDDRRQPDRGWAVLADPEGNEFCVLLSDQELAARENA
ncbi:glyoxalase [Flexivirga endophytica]|uniref:Glyoxalase n=2 Tax=Flexivirga endophytica TaxID=1849103 RepID=A0A916WP58_9MICO|nr:glyoxalase [Flexivirga endophytica]GHB39067.1 glyoxalase [Flexivirga endophytica]